MLVYKVDAYVELVLPNKDRKMAWKAYTEDVYWVYDLSDLKSVYQSLYTNWDDDNSWKEVKYIKLEP